MGETSDKTRLRTPLKGEKEEERENGRWREINGVRYMLLMETCFLQYVANDSVFDVELYYGGEENYHLFLLIICAFTERFIENYWCLY